MRVILVRVKKISGVSIAAVSAGFAHTCAIAVSGGLLCWGLNEYGQLGIGSTASQGLPQDVYLGSGTHRLEG